MSEPASDARDPVESNEPRRSCACPACRRVYRLPSSAEGRQTTCVACATPFTVQFDGTEDRTVARCTVCHAPIDAADEAVTCAGCGAVAHAPCRAFVGGCAIYGCAETPATEAPPELEREAAVWGATAKACPACGEEIQAAAVRCRHCGVTFSTIEAQSHAEFTAERRRDASARGQRAIAVSVLIGGLFTCTAPIVGVAGGVAWLTARDALDRFSALDRGLFLIGTVVGAVQSVLLLGVAIVATIAG